MLRPGDEIDRYVVEAQVGEGGVARVYRVRHRSLGTTFALKVLAVDTGRLRRRALAEARTQAALDHPNLLQVLDAFDADGSPCLLMPYVRGPSMDLWLARHRPEPEEAAVLFGAIWSGVQRAHAFGAVHRDLKPGNVLLDVDGPAMVPKVTDFGLVKLLDEPLAQATATGALLGTPAYTSPEQFRDPRSVDQRADLFSLGCVLYELLSGRRAFQGDGIAAIVEAVSRRGYVPLERLDPKCPYPLLELVDGLLEPDRDRRLDADAVTAMIASVTPPPDERVPVRLRGHALGREAAGAVAALALASEVPEPSAGVEPTPAETVDYATAVGATAVGPAAPRRPWVPALGVVSGLLLAIGAAATWSSRDGDPPGAPDAIAQVAPAAVASAVPAPVPLLPPDPVPADPEPAPIAAPRPGAAPIPDDPVPAPAPSPTPQPEPEAVPEEDALVDAAIEAPAPPPAALALAIQGTPPAAIRAALDALARDRGLATAPATGQVPALAIAFGDAAARTAREQWPTAPQLAVSVSPGTPAAAAVIARPDPEAVEERLRLLIPGVTAISGIFRSRDPWWTALAEACERDGIGFVGDGGAALPTLPSHITRAFSRSQILVIAPDPALWSPDALAQLFRQAALERGRPFPVFGFAATQLDAAQAPTGVVVAGPPDPSVVAGLAAELLDGRAGRTVFSPLWLEVRSRHALIESGAVLNKKSAAAVDRFREE